METWPGSQPPALTSDGNHRKTIPPPSCWQGWAESVTVISGESCGLQIWVCDRKAKVTLQYSN